MSLDKKLFKAVSTTTTADAPQGLVLHLDANDEDSIEQGGANDGNTNGTWFDISTHDLNIPLADKASNLQLHLNASDTTSYSGSGTTWTDISGNSRNGTITDPVFESGFAGGLDFNSATGTSGDKVAVAHDAAFNQQNNMSFEVWVKRDGTTEDNILYKGNASGNSYFLTYNTSWGYYFYSYALGGGTYTGTSGLSTGVYEHVVVTIDGSGNRKIYVNGSMSANNNVHSATGTGSLTDTGPLTIGGYYPYAVHGGFDGRISVVRIYDTVLTASDVAQNYRAGNNLVYSSTYNTGLALDFDPADIDNSSATATWTDKVASLTLTESGTAEYEKELGNYVDLQGADYFGNDSATNTIKDSDGDFTLEFWVNFNAHSGNNVILGVNQSSGVRGLLLYYGSSTMDLYVYKNGTTLSSMYGTPSWSTLGISTGEWYHMAIVTDASTNMKWYVNGILKATYTNNAGGTHWTDMYNIRIGDDATLGYDINAKIGNFKIYKGLLSDVQVVQNYLATKKKYPNEHHATNNGATFTYGSTPYHFDFVSNDYFRTSSIPITWTSGFAYEIYFKADSNTQSYPISTSGSTNPALSWRNYSGWKLVAFHYRSSSSVDYLSSDATSTGQWYHIVYTANDSGGQIYTNGSLSDSSSNSVRTGDYNDYFDIGRLGGGNYLDGKIGMVKIYAKHLSASEVSANYDATKSTYGLS